MRARTFHVSVRFAAWFDFKEKTGAQIWYFGSTK